jgi:polysaccharide biosynthesis protein PslH
VGSQLEQRTTGPPRVAGDLVDRGRLRVLVVSTMFPFPPRSGFETRVYQLTRQLARRHDVTLLSYADAGDAVAALADEVRVETVRRPRGGTGRKRARQLAALAGGRPFSAASVRSTSMQSALRRLCARGSFDAVQFESSPLGVLDLPTDVPVLLDEHNIEHEVFQRMRDGESSPLRRNLYRAEYRGFRRFEELLWRRVAGCIVTSTRDEQVVRAHAPQTPTAVVPNGVDPDYFRASGAAADPRTLVFNGVLDYRPNVDAAHFLVEEVLPLVRRRFPETRLTIVGRGAPGELQQFRGPGVEVTGEVPDVRPYLERAAVVVVPIRMGGGTRLKVVEGLSMARPIVSTSVGCEGVDVQPGEHLLVADGAAAFAESTIALLEDTPLATSLGRAGRVLVEQRYSWATAGDELERLYRRVVTTTGRARA